MALDLVDYELKAKRAVKKFWKARSTAKKKQAASGNFAGGAFSAEMAQLGLGLGVVMIGGTFVGKKILDRLEVRQYIVVVEVALIVAGLFLVGSAVWAG